MNQLAHRIQDHLFVNFIFFFLCRQRMELSDQNICMEALALIQLESSAILLRVANECHVLIRCISMGPIKNRAYGIDSEINELING